MFVLKILKYKSYDYKQSIVKHVYKLPNFFPDHLIPAYCTYVLYITITIIFYTKHTCYIFI